MGLQAPNLQTTSCQRFEVYMDKDYTHIKMLKNNGMPLSTDLYSNLRKDILQGKYQSGYKLTEQAICDEYHISRTPVREAFKQLETEGLIETIPNRGAFVRSLSLQDIKDIYEMRKAYEILAVQWAIQRITKEELEKLEEAFEFMEFYTQKRDIEKMLNINMNFHELIYSASKNKMLKQVLSTLHIYIKHSRESQTYEDDYLDTVLLEHREIYEAFRDKDVKKGTSAIAKHLDNAKNRAQ